MYPLVTAFPTLLACVQCILQLDYSTTPAIYILGADEAFCVPNAAAQVVFAGPEDAHFDEWLAYYMRNGNVKSRDMGQSLETFWDCRMIISGNMVFVHQARQSQLQS